MRITGKSLISAPTVPVVTLAQMQSHLHLDLVGSPPSHPDDADIEHYVAAATADLEDVQNGWLGLSLMPQTRRITTDGFPCSTPKNRDASIFIPDPPLVEVLSVRYRDTSGAWVTMTEGVDYQVVTEGNPHGRIRPLYLRDWPLCAELDDAVEVTFRCGYDDTASPANPLPSNIRQWVQLFAGLMYEQRESDAINVNIQPIENFYRAIQRIQVVGP